jgi:2-polyprenyl-3-methyl-5-hydroxy-6-metoxy-1,4-benzoquinol methylase
MNKKLRDISKYWEKKILKWETLRYSKWLIFSPFSWTIRSRFNKSASVIKQRAISSWSVLELGCGSGILAAEIGNQLSRYCGVDIAHNAIEAARRKNQLSHAKFVTMDVLEFPIEEYDLTLFLGLTDWLEENQLKKLFSKIQSTHIFFSYTETRVVSKISPYLYYRKMIDQNVQEYNYGARTFSFEFISSLLVENGYSVEIIQAASFLNPGVLIWAKK